MAIPVYLWLKDDGGADIKGSVDVQEREGSIEVLALDHSVYIPTDNNTGKLTGTRVHAPFLFTKEIDASSRLPVQGGNHRDRPSRAPSSSGIASTMQARKSSTTPPCSRTSRW